jgi:alpha-D-ribose 1-methylphosphonate 5-triphosphate synthase subunit PhnH
MALDEASDFAVLPGFADPVLDSSRAFRVLLEAMAHPATIARLDLALPRIDGADPAALATLLTLVDVDTPLWLAGHAQPALTGYLRFHCGCRIVADPGSAHFALLSRAVRASRAFVLPVGSDEYPDRSATAVVEVASLREGVAQRVRGPGIRTSASLAPVVDAGFWSAWRANAALYPCGIDIIFTCGNELMALPRSSRLES